MFSGDDDNNRRNPDSWRICTLRTLTVTLKQRQIDPGIKCSHQPNKKTNRTRGEGMTKQQHQIKPQRHITRSTKQTRHFPNCKDKDFESSLLILIYVTV